MSIPSFIIGFVAGEVVGLVSTFIIVSKRQGHKTDNKAVTESPESITNIN